MTAILSFFRRRYKALLLLLTALAALSVLAAKADVSTGHHSESTALLFLWIAIILIAAKLSNLVELAKQPAVLGELLVGVILGNLAIFGFDAFEAVKSDPIILFLSELGVVILLFQIGLGSNLEKMAGVGKNSLLVAATGVAVPFLLGTYVVGPWLLPGLAFHSYLFIGATLTATSVGVTARIFQDLGKSDTREARVILGAAVIDDILGLIILAATSAIVTTGNVDFGDVAWIAVKAFAFLILAVVLGKLLAKALGKAFARIHTGTGMKFTLAICFGLIFAFLAEKIGLAPIIGAFAAGLILDPVYFHYFKDPKVVREIKSALKDSDDRAKDEILSIINSHANRHIEDLIKPIGLFFTPVFFVVTGMNVDIRTFFDPTILAAAIGISVAAFLGKLVSGIFAGKGTNKFIVGLGMIPRGEVGLIFAMTGKILGAFSDRVFSVMVIMVILSTILAPSLISFFFGRHSDAREK